VYVSPAVTAYPVPVLKPPAPPPPPRPSPPEPPPATTRYLIEGTPVGQVHCPEPVKEITSSDGPVYLIITIPDPPAPELPLE
jgi:hypothetical protein